MYQAWDTQKPHHTRSFWRAATRSITYNRSDYLQNRMLGVRIPPPLPNPSTDAGFVTTSGFWRNPVASWLRHPLEPAAWKNPGQGDQEAGGVLGLCSGLDRLFLCRRRRHVGRLVGIPQVSQNGLLVQLARGVDQVAVGVPDQLRAAYVPSLLGSSRSCFGSHRVVFRAKPPPRLTK